jgi:hypothetical protein
MPDMSSTRRNRKRDRRAAFVLLLLLLGALGLLLAVDREGSGTQGGVPVEPGDVAKRSAPAADDTTSPSESAARSSRTSDQVGGASHGATRRLPFHVAGAAADVVVGTWTPVRATIGNPNDVAVTVTGLRAVVSGRRNGCDARVNFETRSSHVPFTVPAHAERFPVPRASRPAIRLRSLPTNQDRCKRQTFALAFVGRASRT